MRCALAGVRTYLRSASVCILWPRTWDRRCPAGRRARHPVSARDARRGREAGATDRPAPGRAPSVLRAGHRNIPGSASAEDQRGPLRRARLLLVRRAERGGGAEAARADRPAAMMRVLLLPALLPASAFAYDETVHAFI